MRKTGLFDYLFKNKKEVAVNNYFKMLNGYSPVFTTYSGGVYEMDLTRAAIHRFATHCSKLKPEMTGAAKRHLEKVLQFSPNYFMSTPQFLYRVATIWEVDNNVFIIPVEEPDIKNPGTTKIVGYYPLLPQQCELVEAAGVIYLRYTFASGERAAIEFDRVGILNQYQYSDDLFGENNATLKPTMQLLHSQNEAIVNAVKNSANIRFLAKVSNVIKSEDINKERDRFTQDNLSEDNKSGMIIYDPKFSELKQIDSKPYTVNALQMQQINQNVFMHYGTNMDILTNSFNEDNWNAYYEGKVEPFAILLSIVMSNMTFSKNEIAHGNSILWTANRLQYASSNTKLQVSTQLFDRGLLSRNDVMDIWNMAHVEDGDKHYIRKEYTEVSKLDNQPTTPPPIPAEPTKPAETEGGETILNEGS